MRDDNASTGDQRIDTAGGQSNDTDPQMVADGTTNTADDGSAQANSVPTSWVPGADE